ncbi:MAG: DNA cytosine methyltransferase [Blastocatellia bacterium]
MKSVELFVGAGGLAMGVSQAGFRHQAVVEWDKNACDTIRENQKRKVAPVFRWPLFECDIREFNFGCLPKDLDLLAGGPPCQPFSLGGKHRGHEDERDMFPATVRVVRQMKPRAFLFENVKGLKRASFARYFEYIKLQLTYPEISRRNSDDWTDHLSRLERHHTCGRENGLYYRVLVGILNAANFGVPQKRERVIIVGFRSDIRQAWSFPEATHSQDGLLYSQFTTGEYWERHRIAKGARPPMSERLKARVARLESFAFEQPWMTVRDAISDLPDPGRESNSVLNHQFIPGARTYTGHTGSPLDEPAKTLKAGDHGVPGGENMVAFPDGRVRYFTVRESARLQTFPDNYLFKGSWGEIMRQLGNAVPVALGRILASSIRAALAD